MHLTKHLHTGLILILINRVVIQFYQRTPNFYTRAGFLTTDGSGHPPSCACCARKASKLDICIIMLGFGEGGGNLLMVVSRSHTLMLSAGYSAVFF